MKKTVKLRDVCFSTATIEDEYRLQVSSASDYSIEEMEVARNQMEKLNLRCDSRTGSVYTSDRGCCSRYTSPSDFTPHQSVLHLIVWELWSWVRNQASRNRLEKKAG